MNRELNMKRFAAVTAAFVASFALSAVPCFAQQKQTPPPGGPPKPFTVPAHETYELPNGMKVTPRAAACQAGRSLTANASKASKPSPISA